MVDIFRAKEFIYDITNEAIEIKANIIWTQEGIVDENAASLGIKSGLKVVMNKCPKKILESWNWTNIQIYHLIKLWKKIQIIFFIKP